MTIDRTDIKGLVAKGIPEQTNFCDCGVYLVGYIEEFLKNPSEFARKALSRELDKNNDFAGFNPSAMRSSIREHLLLLEREQKELKRLRKKEARDAKLAKAAALIQLDGSSGAPETGRNVAESSVAPQSSRPASEVAETPEPAEGPKIGDKMDVDTTADATDPARSEKTASEKAKVDPTAFNENFMAELVREAGEI